MEGRIFGILRYATVFLSFICTGCESFAVFIKLLFNS